jgi:uncharacterized protein
MFIRNLTIRLWPAVLIGAQFSAAANVNLALPDAAMRGDKVAVLSLLKNKADVNVTQGDGSTALYWAVSRDDMPMARALIAAGANANAAARIDSEPLLFAACRNGNPLMIALLLKAGANTNGANERGTTALMMAATSGNPDAVKTLLDHGADVNAKESVRGQTALMFAAAKNRGEVIRLLVAHHADMGVTTKVVKTVRMHFSPEGVVNLDEGTDNPGAKKAAGRPAEPASEEKDQESAAEAKGNADRKGSVDGKATPAKGDGAAKPRREVGTQVVGGMTALLYAARDNNMDAARTLVETGANVNQVEEAEKLSPLVIAIVNGHYELAKYLVDHGADPNVATVQGVAALYAVMDVEWVPHNWFPEPVTAQEKVKYLDLMKDLIEHGANVNARLVKKPWFRTTSHDASWVDVPGATPFWRAAQACDLTAMQFLLDHGADPNIATEAGVTPLMVASGLGWGWNFSVNSSAGWIGATKFLLAHNANVNLVAKDGNTALHGAAYVGDNDLVKLLTSSGAKVDVKNKAGDSIADMANGPNRFGIPHPETVALLEKLGSPNQHNCRSDQCLVAAKEDKKPATADPVNGKTPAASTKTPR